MSRTRIWFARDCWLTSDFKVERIGMEHGAEGVLAFEEVLALMKLEGADDGTVRIPFTLLGRRAFVRNVDKVRKIVESLASEDLVEIVQAGKNEFVARLPRWARWQTGDPRNAERQARHRRRTGGSNGQAALLDPEEEGDAPKSDQVAAEFAEWLADHAKVTGRTPPGPQTKAFASLLSSYAARRAEDYSPEQLKLASRGAHADDFRRDNGYDKAESVLRPTKVHDLIEAGRRAEESEVGDERERDQARLEKAGLA